MVWKGLSVLWCDFEKVLSQHGMELRHLLLHVRGVAVHFSL